jgi:hypothetical protein
MLMNLTLVVYFEIAQILGRLSLPNLLSLRNSEATTNNKNNSGDICSIKRFYKSPREAKRDRYFWERNI